MNSSAKITDLLIDWSAGNSAAQEKLFPLVERELHRLAHRYVKHLAPGDSLQTTGLINEAYIRLVDQSRVQWQNRAHFFGIAATMMRRILLNYLRDGKRHKRGGNLGDRLPFDETRLISDEKGREIIALEDALCELEVFDERKAKVVELRYFGGLTVEETAQFLNISESTAMRDWTLAKAWLAREIEK